MGIHAWGHHRHRDVYGHDEPRWPFPMVPTTFLGLDMAADDLEVNDNLSGGVDTVIFNGTAGNDSIAVVSGGAGFVQVGMSVNGNLFTDLEISGISSVRVRGLAGDDTITHGSNGVAFTVPITYEGGDPSSGSDVLLLTGRTGVADSVTIIPDAANPTEQDVTGLGAVINVSGVELIRYTGTLSVAGGTDDTLTVNPGSGDDLVRVESSVGGGAVDVVTTATLPKIQFTGLNTIIIDAFGSDTVTFKTELLGGALPGNYRMLASILDTLIIEGSDGALAENFIVTNPTGADTVAVTDTFAAFEAGVTVTAVDTGTPLGRLQLNTLGGDDTVTVDVTDEAGAANGIISVPITFDGGLGSDKLVVTGNPAANGETAVANVTYSPGPSITEGRLLYQGAAAATLMTINYVNLEPVVDLIPAATLTVNGTNADNAINYTAGSVAGRGLVTVDAYESIEFSNKTNLILNGLAGSDTLNLSSPGVPVAGLASITVNGGDPTASDKIIVNGTAGVDVLTIDQLTSDGAHITGLGPTINVTTAEHLIYNGQGNDDQITVTTPLGFDQIAFQPGSTVARPLFRSLGGCL